MLGNPPLGLFEADGSLPWVFISILLQACPLLVTFSVQQRKQARSLSSSSSTLHSSRISTMSPPPAWVKALKPATPQGSELLEQERAQSNVAVDKLAELLHTKDVLDRQDRLVAILSSEKVFDKSQTHSLGRVERLQRALAKGKRLQQLAVQNKWSQEEFYAAADLIGEPTPYGLHSTMFLVCLFALVILCSGHHQLMALFFDT